MVTMKQVYPHDTHGNTRALLSTTGAALERYDYDAFGNAIGFEPSQALTQFLYCGEQFDTLSGWYYLRARYYDPKVGRFNRLDPFFGNTSDPQSLHKYTYCHGDPVNNVDPSGRFLVGFGIGAVMSMLTKIKSDKFNVGVGLSISKTIKAITSTWTFWVYDLLFTLQAGFSAAFVPCFWLMQGPLTAKIAGWYSIRGLIGATGIGQAYIRLADGTKHFTDDGTVEVFSQANRKRWMYEYAIKNGAVIGHSLFMKMTTQGNWVDTGENVNVQTFWIGGLYSFMVKGEYEIRITGQRQFELRNVNLHWAGSDVVDAHDPWHPQRESGILGTAESLVWVIGDTWEGASYPIWIHTFESKPEIQENLTCTPKD